jgi:group I intron endonuclease
MTEPIIGVYKITCLSSGKCYIGYSKEIEKRFHTHKMLLRASRHFNILLQRAYDKYGCDDFTFEILHTCNATDEAKELELKYLEDINIRPFLYNLHYNNSGGDIITHHPNRTEIIEKMTRTITDRFNNMTKEEKQQKYGQSGEKNGMYGRTHTDEVKKRSSEMHKGNTYCKGKKASDETRLKLSIVASQRIGDANPFFGKHHSEETKQKIREANKGRLPPNTTQLVIDNVHYNSLADASRELDIPVPTILWRLKSKNKKFDNYKYADADKQKIMDEEKQIIPKLSDEAKRKMRHRSKRVSINAIVYNSFSEAAIHLKTTYLTIRKRIESNDPKFADYKYADDQTNEIAS